MKGSAYIAEPALPVRFGAGQSNTISTIEGNIVARREVDNMTVRIRIARQ
jgi:hypothetical protein